MICQRECSCYQTTYSAKRNAGRLLKLVNYLLEFSRLEAGKTRAHFQPTNLTRLTTDVASMFVSAMETAHLTYQINCNMPPDPVYVDR